MDILNLQNWSFNVYALPYLVMGVLVFILGFFVYAHDTRSLVNKVFLTVVVSTTVWLTGYGLEVLTRSGLIASMIDKYYTFPGVALIAPSCYFIAAVFRQVLHKRKYLVLLGYLINVLFIILNLLFDFFIKGDVKRFWGFHPSFSHISSGMIFLGVFSFFMLASFFEMVMFYRESVSPAQRTRIRYILAAYVVAFLGAGDFGPHLFQNWPLYPVGSFCIFIFFLIHSYVIIRYKAFNIDTVIHRTLLWLLSLVVIILPAGLIVALALNLVVPPGLAWRLVFISLVLIFFVWYYNKLKPMADHFFRRRKYDYYRILGEIGHKVGNELDIGRIAARLIRELKDILFIRNAFILVRESGRPDYLLLEKSGYAAEEAGKKGEQCIRHESGLSRWFDENLKALSREQLKADPSLAGFYKETALFFDRNKIEVLIPVITEDKVNALIGIGKKENLRSYQARDIQLLEQMGKQIGMTIENAIHHKDIIEKERLDEELKLGRKIQTGLLPHEVPPVKGLLVQGMMEPAREIGGDYYDFIPQAEGKELGIVIGDVSGKGVAAGLCMSMVKTAIHIFSARGAGPKEILLRTNEVLTRHIGGEKFMTMLYLVWHAEGSRIIYSSAGHEHILLYKEEQGCVEAIESGGIILGVKEEIGDMLEEKEIKLKHGDKVLLYTDGALEARNDRNERYGLDRLKQAFLAHSRKKPGEMIRVIREDLHAFIGGQPVYDDITLVSLENE